MAMTIDPTQQATEGNGSASRFQSAREVATVGKADAVRCLQAAIESFTAARGLSREQLAEDICGVSAGHFSKITNAQQGDFFGFVYDKLPGEIRQDFIERLAELERLDPFAVAVEQLMVAAIRLIRTGRGSRLPAKASRMAKMDERERETRTA